MIQHDSITTNTERHTKVNKNPSDVLRTQTSTPEFGLTEPRSIGIDGAESTAQISQFTIPDLEKTPGTEVLALGHCGTQQKKGWKTIAGVMFCEFVGLSSLSLPRAIAVLGWIGGAVTIVVMWSICTYTSYTLWQFCLRYPGEIRSIADISRKLSGCNKWVVRGTIISFMSYAISICAVHTHISSVILNILTGHSLCTVVFAFLGALVCCLLSMSQRFSTCGTIGLFSAFTMTLAVCLTIGFLKTGHMSDPMKSSSHTTSLWADTADFVDIFNGVLTISFSFVGQIAIPSLIDEMKHPPDFGKALFTVQFCLLAFFTFTGMLVYSMLGAAVPSPIISALQPIPARIVFGLAIPADICIGALFCFVAVKFLIQEICWTTQQENKSRLCSSKAIWISTTIVFWTFAWLVAQVIPFFTQLLDLLSAVFGSYFGFGIWSWAYFHLIGTKRFSCSRNVFCSVLNIMIALFGGLFLFGGSYSSIVGISRAYALGNIGGAFSCDNNAG